MSFDEWFAQLKQLAVSKHSFTPEAAETLDPEAFRTGYFVDGYTPEDAIDEDMTCWD